MTRSTTTNFVAAVLALVLTAVTFQQALTMPDGAVAAPVVALLA